MRSHCEVPRIATIAIGVVLAAQSIGAARVQTAVRRQNGAIAGRILAPNGSPAAGTRVIAIAPPAAPPVPRQTQTPVQALAGAMLLMSLTMTDTDGRYLLTDVPPGRYYVGVGPLEPLNYFPGASLANATLVAVTAGATAEVGDFHLKGPPRKVSGRVVRQGHESGTRISLEGTPLKFNAPIGKDGSFVFPEVTPGTYQIRVTPDISPLGIAISVAEKDIEQLTVGIPLSAVMSASLDVRAIVEGGAPIRPKLQFRLVPVGATTLTAPANRIMTVSEKTARIQLPVGEYFADVVLSEPLPVGYAIKSIMARRNGLNEPLKQPLILSPPITSVDIVLGITAAP